MMAIEEVSRSDTQYAAEFKAEAFIQDYVCTW